MSGSNLLDTFKGYMPTISGMLVKIGYMPDAPVECISLNSVGAEDPVRFFGMTQQLEYPVISVRVRSAVYDTGFDACTTIKNTMKNIHNTDFLGISVLQGIADLGKDENNRNYFEVIFKVIIKE